MGEVTDLRNALLDALTTALPLRVVTRDLRDFAGRADADLQSGIITILGGGEKDYANTLGRIAMLGTLPITLVGQIRVAENSAPSAVEDAEDALADEIKEFCRAPGDPLLGGLSMLGYRQSAQLEHPYGWIVADLEILR